MSINSILFYKVKNVSDTAIVCPPRDDALLVVDFSRAGGPHPRRIPRGDSQALLAALASGAVIRDDVAGCPAVPPPGRPDPDQAVPGPDLGPAA